MQRKVNLLVFHFFFCFNSPSHEHVTMLLSIITLNSHFAKELSYQKSIGKLFCQYVLCDKATGEKLETEIAKK